ncbi:unnamed protein product [Ambrosiozyma monospora]|uniref:Unnamed protein product n=1 Tax=Ambrosiozyma monospora TaxID=43982 RepID=A0ACB5UB34_AMBMO|nr:unnamed protein product [Ambrosiozyma monospora]
MPDLITPNVSIQFPPKAIFSPQCSKVEGTIELDFRPPFNYDYSLNASFKGTCDLSRCIINDNTWNDSTSSTEVPYDYHLDLFPELKVILVPVENHPHALSFSFYFPDAQTLPKSTDLVCKWLKAYQDSDGYTYTKDDSSEIPS